MKRLGILIILLSAVLAYGVSAIYQGGTSGYSVNGSDVMYCYVYEVDGDVNDFDQTLTLGNCILDRVVIDTNGTDTSYKVYIYETTSTYNDITLWSKVDCNTASSATYSQPITMTDGTNVVGGVPSDGNLQITLADGDDATLDALQVYVYYRRR